MTAFLSVMGGMCEMKRKVVRAVTGLLCATRFFKLAKDCQQDFFTKGTEKVQNGKFQEL